MKAEILKKKNHTASGLRETPDLVKMTIKNNNKSGNTD